MAPTYILEVIWVYSIPTDNGNSWTVSDNLNGELYWLYAYEDKLFASTQNGLFISFDNGFTWADLNSGLPTKYISSIVVSGTNLL